MGEAKVRRGLDLSPKLYNSCHLATRRVKRVLKALRRRLTSYAGQIFALILCSAKTQVVDFAAMSRRTAAKC